MRASRLRLLIAAGLALLSPGAAAVDLSGTAGGGYVQTNSSSSAGDASGTRSWDFAGNLSFAGEVERSGILSYGGGAAYQTLHSAYFDSSSASNGFTYSASASALAEKPFNLALSLSQGWNRFNSEGGSTTTGDTRARSETASAALALPGMPAVSLNASRSDAVNHSFGQESQTESTTLGASVTQQFGAFGYSLAYGTGFNQGTLAETNYRRHDFTGLVSANLSRDVRLMVNDQYHLRLPTREAPTNPRYDDHGIGAGTSWALSEKVNSRVDYAYQRSLVTAPTVPDQELLSHGASLGVDYRYRPDLSFHASASGLVGLVRTGATEERVLGQSVGGGAAWGHEYARFRLQTQGNLALNAAEPDTGSAVLGYTAGGGSSLATWIRGWNCAFGYNASYGSASGGLAGSSFGHGVTASADGAPWRGAYSSVSLTASSARSESPLFGTSMSRNVALNVSGSWKAVATTLTLGMSDGLADPLRRTGFADGLFVPSRFNTRSRHATLFASAALVRNLSLRGVLKYLESTSPGREKQWEEAGSVSLGYAIGAFTFSAEDSVSRGGYGDYRRTANVVMLQAMRTFGGLHF